MAASKHTKEKKIKKQGRGKKVSFRVVFKQFSVCVLYILSIFWYNQSRSEIKYTQTSPDSEKPSCYISALSPLEKYDNIE